MLTAGVGYSTYPLTDGAGQEAASLAMERGGLSHADLVFLFATFDHAMNYPLLFQAVAQTCGTEEIVGCSASGVLTTDEEMEFRPGVAVMAIAGEGMTPACFVVDSEGLEDERVAQSIAARVQGKEKENSYLVLLTDIFNVNAPQVISQLQKTLGPLPIIGAAASGPAHIQKTRQWYGPTITDHGVAGVLLSGAFQASTALAQGCTPIGEPYIVTKAQENLILEVANRPTAEVLAEAINQLPPDDIPEAAGAIFLGIAMDERKYPLERGDYLVRNILGMDRETGAIAAAQVVHEGQTVQFQFRHSQAAREEMEKTLGRMARFTNEAAPAFGLYFNCMGRGYSLYQEPNYDVNAIRQALGSIPIIGFFGNAEFGPILGQNLVHNYTGVLTLFFPGTAR